MPNWDFILHSSSKEARAVVRKSNSKKHRILIATSISGHIPALILGTTIATALKLRGAQVHALLNDGVLAASEQAVFANLSSNIKKLIRSPDKITLSLDKIENFKRATSQYQSIGVKVHKFSDYLSIKEKEQATKIASEVPFSEIGDFEFDHLPIGKHALAGTLRFFARGDLNGEPYAEDVLRRYLDAALTTAFVMHNLLSWHNFDCIAFHHGIYVPQGPIGEVARHLGIRIVNWKTAYRKQRFIFSHKDTYHYTMIDEPTEIWENINWEENKDKKLMDYIGSRWHGTYDWIRFADRSEENWEVISSELGIDQNKPCVGLLTNVVWDAQLHYPANAFSNILEWLESTIHYFLKRPDLQLLIRVHPGELKGVVSRQTVGDELNKRFLELPQNVFVIPPESPWNTYSICERCNAVIIYATKTGIELSCMGIPVIVAGEAWIRNKGIAIDVNNPNEYFEALDKLPLSSRLDEKRILRAKRYAYHFFFKRMIPLKCVTPTNTFPPYVLGIKTADELKAGYDPGLDIICNGILRGDPFVYPAENEIDI